MAIETKCLTPDSQFHTEVDGSCDYVAISVDLPAGIISDITEAEAELLAKLMHNQIELVLRPYFVMAEMRRANSCKETEGEV